MNKRLEELVEIYGNSRAVENDWSPRCHSTDEVRKHYRAGANALLAELMPRVGRLTACIQELHDQCGYASPWQIRMSKELTEWREFMGEG